ncbi:hypothetical protein ACFWHQ_39350 [Streptomyces sp. NPDC060334]|uniref:hypothetical protein n=1 Tax=Streptomyces sp. NPDC060334 TaxID=3347099 RepID=UPI003656B017
MTPEQFTAVVGLGGVALGIGGTLIAARVQLKGSHAQAEATRRAAETTAVTQYASTLVQQNRAAQRAAYVAFVSQAREFTREIDRAIVGTSWASDDSLGEPLRRLSTAFSAVELEGPMEVIAAGSAIMEGADALTTQFDYSIAGYRAWYKFHAVDREHARQALTALDALRSVARPLTLAGHRIRVGGDLAEATQQLDALGALGAHWRQKYVVAHAELAALCAAGTLEASEMAVLLGDAGNGRIPQDVSVENLESGLFSAMEKFTECARQQLNDTRPEHRVD